MSNYIYGSRLSYRDYLQAKSFEEAFTSHISKQTRAIIASNAELHTAHISVSSSLHETVSRGFESVSRGFEQLSFDLQAINQGVSELNASFQWGSASC